MVDAAGRGGQVLDLEYEPSMKCWAVWEELGEPSSDIEPVLKGRHLIALGWKPGKHFAAPLAKAYEHQLETGCEDVEELLEVALSEDNQ